MRPGGLAWAALRYDERREVNKKKIHRLWREEGLQVRVHSPRKRAGTSSAPPVIADAPKVVWAIDFQFDSTIDGKAIKIASMVDERTRESLLNLVERSITGERLVEELTKVIAANGGAPKVLRLDNGPEMVDQALQRFCENKTRHGIRAEIWASDRSVSGINQNGHNELKEIRENATETHVTTYLERHRAEEGGRMAQKTCPIQHPSCIAGCERNLGGRTPGEPGKNSVRDFQMKSTCVVTGIKHQEYLGGCRIRARERPLPYCANANAIA